MINSHLGHHMNTTELQLPKHLYTETPSDCGTYKKVIVSPDMLITWAEDGRGDAISRLCYEACDRKIEAIDDWENNRILQLEDEWIAADNDEYAYSAEDEFDDNDEHVRRYHEACEAVAREAEQKRLRAREQITKHQSEVEKLVQEAREFIAAHEPPPQEDNLVVYLLALGAVIAAGYVLFN